MPSMNLLSGTILPSSGSRSLPSIECIARGARAIPSPGAGALTCCVPIPTKPQYCCTQLSGFYHTELIYMSNDQYN